MSQDIIEKHLLKVGSSRYQDEKFKERFPNFSAISRFGIGVLSTFMIADNVDVVTCNPEDEVARQISLRSVHGRYLIRLLDKRKDEVASKLYPHGTLVRLKLRPTARAGNILAAMRRWIVVPGCKVTFVEPGAEAIDVGFASPKEAVKAYLAETQPVARAGDRDRVDVIEKSRDGITIAYAVKWSETFREWALYRVGDLESRREGNPRPPVCTCVEGIAVEFTTPGFTEVSILAVANATGKKAPKTNVARSALEQTEEIKHLASVVYGIFQEQIVEEVSRLIKEENFSLTWATTEAQYLAFPFGGEMRRRARDEEQLTEISERLPLLLVEDRSVRSAKSLLDLKQLGQFWTVDSRILNSAETLIREFPSESTVTKALKELSGARINLPTPLLCNATYYSLSSQDIWANFEVTAIRAIPSERRVDLAWAEKGDPKRWIDFPDVLQRAARDRSRARQGIPDVLNILRDRLGRRQRELEIFVGAGEVGTDGLEGCCAVRSLNCLFVMPDQPVAKYLSGLEAAGDVDSLNCFVVYATLLSLTLATRPTSSTVAELVTDRHFKQLEAQGVHLEFVKRDEFIASVVESDLGVFDPSIWSRRAVDWYEVD